MVVFRPEDVIGGGTWATDGEAYSRYVHSKKPISSLTARKARPDRMQMGGVQVLLMVQFSSHYSTRDTLVRGGFPPAPHPPTALVRHTIASAGSALAILYTVPVGNRYCTTSPVWAIADHTTGTHGFFCIGIGFMGIAPGIFNTCATSALTTFIAFDRNAALEERHRCNREKKSKCP